MMTGRGTGQDGTIVGRVWHGKPQDQYGAAGIVFRHISIKQTSSRQLYRILLGVVILQMKIGR